MKCIKIKKNNSVKIILISIICIVLGIGIYIIYNYSQAKTEQKNNNYEVAISYYQKIEFINKVKEQENECYYQRGIQLKNEKNFDSAINYFDKIINYKDTNEQIQETKYQKAISKYNSGNFDETYELLKTIVSYKDSLDYINNIDKINLYEGIWIENWDEMLNLPEWKGKKNIINKKDCNILIIKGWDIKEYQVANWGKYTINGKRYNLIEEKTFTLENDFIQQYFKEQKFGTYLLENNLLKFRNNMDEISYVYSKNSDDFNSIIVEKQKEPQIGMNKTEVENSTWGKPKKINRTKTSYGTHEQWCYSTHKYIYFEDGIVTSIQD